MLIHFYFNVAFIFSALKQYFILDNTPVDFQLNAIDSDLPAGDVLEYFILNAPKFNLK